MSKRAQIVHEESVNAADSKEYADLNSNVIRETREIRGVSSKWSHMEISASSALPASLR